MYLPEKPYAPVTAIRMSLGLLWWRIDRENASEPIEIGRPGRSEAQEAMFCALQASHRSTLNPQRTSTRSLFVRFEHRTNGGDHV
jgi:hypothetical protein